jgi:hypothetical protein
MTDNALLEHLEEIALRLGIQLRYENLLQGPVRIEGGYCVLEGKPMILINRKDSHLRKIRILSRSLSKHNLEAIFIPPAVRKAIERHGN